MVTVKEVRNQINELAPYELAEEWDNSGLILGRCDMAVRGILIALDVTKEVLSEAEEMDCNLIITHHPFLFSPMKRVTDENFQGDILLTAAENKIALLCAHTNLDMARDGINDRLCRILEIAGEEEILPFKTGMISREMNLRELLGIVKNRLGCYGLKYTGNMERKIKKVSICSGSGSDFLSQAAIQGADVLITADAKYHDHQKASQLGICLIDAGHFETEHIICPVLQSKLKKVFPSLKIEISRVHEGFYQYFNEE